MGTPGSPPAAAAAGVVPQPGAPVPGKVIAPTAGPVSLERVKAERVTTTDKSGAKISQEPGNRTIIQQDNRIIVTHNETTSIQTINPGARVTTQSGGITETVYVRPDGVSIISEVDGNGRLLRRFGRAPGGPEIVYVDNRKFYRNVVIGTGIAAFGIGVALTLAPPRITIPRERYIVEYERADDDDLYRVLEAPPVERLERDYSLDEIRYNHTLRDHMPRIDLDTVNFATGSFTVTSDEYPKLERVARAIARVIERNPTEMFLIEGHTDAVGSDEDNLSLSDRRAESIARVLIEYFSIPAENLVTQGYGKQYLKIDTQAPERANRRVAIRRISPLLGRG